MNTANNHTPETSTWKIEDPGIFRRKFRAVELYHWFCQSFPESFGIEIFRSEDLNKVDWDERAWRIEDNGYRNYYNRKYLTEYTLYDRAILNVTSGDENTYLRFFIEDENGNCHIVSWGYKRYEVEYGDYAGALAALIFKTCYEHERGPVDDRYDFCIVELKDYYINK